jgi:hypothetical protein
MPAETAVLPEVTGACAPQAMGHGGERVAKNGDAEVWAKQLKDGSRAVVLFNRGNGTQEIAANWEDLGYPDTISAAVRDLWQHSASQLTAFLTTCSALISLIELVHAFDFSCSITLWISSFASVRLFMMI